MASFEERSISSKVDSSDAETNEKSSEKVRKFHLINVKDNVCSLNTEANFKMADNSSTMENVIAQNRVQLQSTSNDSHSDTSSGQTDCNSNSNNGHFDAENIVSSTQETTNDSFNANAKLNSDSSDSIVNKCDVTDVKSSSPKLMANEKHISSEPSHVASALSNQNKKPMDEPKRHLHISDSPIKAKSKSIDNGLYSFGCFFLVIFNFQTEKPTPIFSCISESSAVRSSQKKKKKDRERDRDRDKNRDRDRDKDREKDKSRRHKSHSSSKPSSSDSKSTSSSSIGKVAAAAVVNHQTEHDSSRLSGNQNSHEKTNKTDKTDKCKSTSTSSSTKPTSSTNQSNQNELNGKHSMNASASHKELIKPNGDLSTDIGANPTLPQQINSTTTATTSNTVQNNRLSISEELNNIPDTTTTDIESTSSKMSPTMAVETATALPKPDRKEFVPSSVSFSGERKPTEVAGIVIKKDYLPPPAKVIKVEKTREDVTRVLNYDTEPNSVQNASAAVAAVVETNSKVIEEKIKVEKMETNIKTEPSDKKISDVEKQSKKLMTNNHISENKENSMHKIESTKKPKETAESGNSGGKIKSEFKTKESNSSSGGGGGDKKESKSSSNDHQHHSSKSSSLKSSSHRSNSSGSGRECSRCYRRSKIKRVSVGIQCCKYGEPFKPMIPTSTPMKNAKTLACNMTDSLYSDLKYGRFFHVEVHTNGGASVVHMYQNEIDSLSDIEMEELTEEFFRIVFSEDENGYAHHVMGIVHDAAHYIPDLLDHMADNYSTLTVKAGVLGRNSDIETSTLVQYYEQVEKNYSHGTFRYGPLHQISLVGKVHEEVGGYFPDLLGRLEANLFLKKVYFCSQFSRKTMDCSFFHHWIGLNWILLP